MYLEKMPKYIQRFLSAAQVFSGNGDHMSLSSAYKKIKKFIKMAFLGYGVFSGENRTLFKSEALSDSRIRTNYALYFIIVLQVFNFIFNINLNKHSRCVSLILLGTLSYTLVCVVYAFLFYFFKHRKVSLSQRNLLIKSFWALILLCSLFFTYANIAEEGSAPFNITLVVLSLAVLPVLTLKEILAYLIPYTAVNIAFSFSLKVPPYTISQQLLILSVISVYVSQLQFSYAVRVFTERKHLSDTNVQLEILSETDPLTGLLNRRGIENHISEFENYYKFSGRYICVLLISIDNFRGRNALLKTADDNIIRIAQCIKACTRQSTDVVARMGGEEFLIISDVKTEGAISLGLRIKRSVSDMKLRLSEKLPPLTVSVGAAQREGNDALGEKTSPVPELITLADAQLANAKACGMNCVSSGSIIFR